MWYNLAYMAAKKLYPMFRPLIVKKIDDPKHEWDETVINILDKVFK